MTWPDLIGVGIVIALFLVSAVLIRRVVRRAGQRFAEGRQRILDLRTNLLPPGPRRNAARLRYRLDAELRATRDMLARAPQGVVFRADAVALLNELAATATELDSELAAIERFLDPAQQQAALVAIAGQVDELIETTYTARHTILRTAAEDRTRQLAALRDSVATQATSLDNYQRQRRRLRL